MTFVYIVMKKGSIFGVFSNEDSAQRTAEHLNKKVGSGYTVEKHEVWEAD